MKIEDMLQEFICISFLVKPPCLSHAWKKVENESFQLSTNINFANYK